ncbi:MAG: OmpA family protein [Ignavibacteriae bacterium]|nr:MAG: OmpA family protein [Ignavibacteriota bacterium]
MKKRTICIAVVAMFLAAMFSAPLPGQYKSKGFRIGVAGGVLQGLTKMDDSRFTGVARVFIRHNIAAHVDGDLAGTIGGVSGNDIYQSDLWLGEYKVLYKPCMSGDWEPYIGAGVGVLFFNANKNLRNHAFESDGYVPYIPVALGVEYALSGRWEFDANANVNYAFSNEVFSTNRSNTGIGTGNDAWWGLYAGISYTIILSDHDADNDGLLNSVEKQIGTDPDKSDTDGDGLSDGDEFNKYHTNPLKADSDGDGLNDKDELMIYKTDPNKADTDGDGLSDGDEVLNTKTDPLKVDTDRDYLTDGDEVMKYKTDPLRTDTDGDGLTDSDEVLKYKTDPLKADADGDGISDRDEVKNGTNPLDSNDPKKPEPPKEVVIPKPEPPQPAAIKAEVGKAIVLEGVVFKSGKSDITPESEQILASAKKTLEENPDLTVEIRGYTDNVGNAKKNLQLSQARAESVKAWLVNGGIDASRVTARGFGSKNPMGDNATAEGRTMNRRIEFFRTK